MPNINDQYWNFPDIPEQNVNQEQVSRDNFLDDEVGSSSILAREVSQNAIDAGSGTPGTAELRIRLLTKKDGLDSDFIKELFTSPKFKSHAESNDSGVDLGSVDFENPTALIIEDFNTSGLTGKTDKKVDGEHFTDFYRNSGRSGKSMQKGTKKNTLGSHGQGTITLFMTSMLSTFFGFTKRDGDPNLYLMGASLFNIIEKDDVFFDTFSWYSDQLPVKKRPGSYRPIPIKDISFVNQFAQAFSIERIKKQRTKKSGLESGLTIVIPFPCFDNVAAKSEDLDKMIGSCIENFFYAIYNSKIKYRINDVEINSTTIRNMAEKYKEHMKNPDFQDGDNLNEILDFTENASIRMSDSKSKDYIELNESWINDEKINEADFTEEDLVEIKELYKNNQTVALTLPMTLKRKDGTQVKTEFNSYIRKFKDNNNWNQGQDMYVRLGMLIKKEQKLKSRKALALMVAEDQPVSQLLRDAEPANHLEWRLSTEKLSKNWQAPDKYVRVIKNSLTDLYSLFAEVLPEKDENAFSSIFRIKKEGPDDDDKPGPKFNKPVLSAPEEFIVTLLKTSVIIKCTSDSSVMDAKERYEIKKYAYKKALKKFPDADKKEADKETVLKAIKAMKEYVKKAPESVQKYAQQTAAKYIKNRFKNKKLKFRAAYDTYRDNPFKNYRPNQFNFRDKAKALQNTDPSKKSNTKDIDISVKNGSIVSCSENKLEAIINNALFEVKAKGFNKGALETEQIKVDQ